VPELKILSQALKEVYEQLGARVTVELFEQGDLTQTVIRPREYDALLFGMVIDRGLDLYAFWHSSGRNDPGLNIAGYANLSTDTLLESIRQEISPEQKAADLSKLYTEIATEYPAVFTHTPQFVYTIAKDLRGVSILM
jgi:ABC-type transport system substrate-binding protein